MNPPLPAGGVELRDVSVRTPEGTHILSEVSIAAGPGERVALLGRSGAGKTTALRIMNGLVTPSSGEVEINGQPMRGQDLPLLRRSIGYMIQGGALFPHRTVFQNVATVPRLLGWSMERARSEAEVLLETLRIPIGQYGERYPANLSGGEKQRVGIARALIARPSILLCDEPFAALDPLVRRELQLAFAALRAAHSPTIVFVTHDLREALTLCDRIVLMAKGRVVLDCEATRFSTANHPLAQEFAEASLAIPETK